MWYGTVLIIVLSMHWLLLSIGLIDERFINYGTVCTN